MISGLLIQSPICLDTAVDFTAENIHLLKSGTLRQDLTNNVYRLVCEIYDWTAIMTKLLDSLEQITYENE